VTSGKYEKYGDVPGGTEPNPKNVLAAVDFSEHSADAMAAVPAIVYLI
jgi:hypothetical protein